MKISRTLMYMNIHKMVYDLICCTVVCLLRPLGNLLLQHSCQILYFVRLKFKFWNCCHHLPFDIFIHSVTNPCSAQCDNYKNLLLRYFDKIRVKSKIPIQHELSLFGIFTKYFSGKSKILVLPHCVYCKFFSLCHQSKVHFCAFLCFEI